MNREEAMKAIENFQDEYDSNGSGHLDEALDFAISDMKRVEKLETKIIIIDGLKAENKRLKEDLSRWQEGEYNHCDLCCSTSRYELKRLYEGIEKVKAEINEAIDTCPITLSKDMADKVLKNAVTDIINKYLGEVGDK